MPNLKAESYTAEAYEELRSALRKTDEKLKKTEIELAIAKAEKADMYELLIEAKAIRRTLYVIFGRSFDNE